MNEGEVKFILWVFFGEAGGKGGTGLKGGERRVRNDDDVMVMVMMMDDDCGVVVDCRQMRMRDLVCDREKVLIGGIFRM